MRQFIGGRAFEPKVREIIKLKVKFKKGKAKRMAAIKSGCKSSD